VKISTGTTDLYTRSPMGQVRDYTIPSNGANIPGQLAMAFGAETTGDVTCPSSTQVMARLVLLVHSPAASGSLASSIG
jgi:hypothetical protein